MCLSLLLSLPLSVHLSVRLSVCQSVRLFVLPDRDSLYKDDITALPLRPMSYWFIRFWISSKHTSLRLRKHQFWKQLGYKWWVKKWWFFFCNIYTGWHQNFILWTIIPTWEKVHYSKGHWSTCLQRHSKNCQYWRTVETNSMSFKLPCGLATGKLTPSIVYFCKLLYENR